MFKVSLWRDGKNGRLTVDETSAIEGKAPGSSTFVNNAKKLYIGGLAKGFTARSVPVSDSNTFSVYFGNKCFNKPRSCLGRSFVELKNLLRQDKFYEFCCIQ